MNKQSTIDRIRPWVPALIFAIALGFRLIGIGWGLPNSLHNQSYHPDEQVIFSFSQHVEPAQLHFTPGVYNYGTLYLTLLSIESKVIEGYGGQPKTEAEFWAFVGRVDLAGRILSAVAGAGTAVVLFFILRRFTRLIGAIAGALMMGVAPGFLVHSRFQTVDVLATFLLALSVLCALSLLHVDDLSARTGRLKLRNDVRLVLLSGLFAGLSAGTKYTGILGVLTLVVCIFLMKQRRSATAEASESPQPASTLALSAMGVGMAFLGLFLSTPGILLDSSRFWRDFRYEMLHTSQGHDLVFVGVGSGFVYHVVNLFQGFTPLALAFGVVGIGYACVKKCPWMFALLAFAIPYYLLIGRAEVLFLRYTFPLYIVLSAGVGYLVGVGHERSGWGKLVVAAGIVVIGLAAQVGALYTGLMTSSDPRDLLALTLRQQSSNSTSVGIVKDPWFYTPALIPDSAAMRGMFPLLVDGKAMKTNAKQAMEMAASTKPKVAFAGFGDDWDPKLVTDLKPDYIVISSFEVGPEWRLRNSKDINAEDRARVEKFKSFESLLEASYNQMDPANTDPNHRYDEADALVHDLQYIRPSYWVWKRIGSAAP